MDDLFYDPFTVPLMIRNFDGDLSKKLKDICLEENKKHEDMTDKSWNKMNFLDLQYPEVLELEKRFVEITKDYVSKVKVPIKPTDEMILECWANVRKGNSYHISHSHPGADLILNYYVSTPKNSKIVYFNPSPAMGSHLWGVKYYEHNIEVKPDMLIVTPPWITHEVPPTYLEEPRISISCNVTFRRLS